MKIPAGFAVFVLGFASVGSAEPKQEETSGRVSHNDKNDPPRQDAPRQSSEWVELASPTPAKHGKEFVMVGKEAGTFGKLRIDAAKGKVVVLRVKVFFDDGKVKVFPVDKKLDAKGRKSTLVDLRTDKPIDRVVITTETYTNGQYALYGSSSGGTVAGR